MANRWLRAGLVFLTVTQGAVGAWQLLLPEGFYENFPLRGHPWVAWLPPFNEHLMRDVGALTLGIVVMLAVASITMDRLLVRTALTAYLVFSVPHFLFHATHLQNFPRPDAIAQTTTLGVGVALPLALLVLSWRGGRPVPRGESLLKPGQSPGRGGQGS